MKQYQSNRKANYSAVTGNLSRSLEPTMSHFSDSSDNVHTLSNKRNWCTFGVGRGPAKHSLRVCTLPLYKIALHIHYTWPIFILLTTISAFQISYLYALYSFLLGGPILFLTVLIHELGHSIMAIKLGGEVDIILLWPLGGLAYISFFGESNPRADALIAISGPLTHIPQIIIWYCLLLISNGGSSYNLYFLLSWSNLWVSLCSSAVMIQLSLCLFNLIPAFPLDGGRLLAALMAWRHVPKKTAYRISAFTGSVRTRDISVNLMRYCG